MRFVAYPCHNSRFARNGGATPAAAAFAAGPRRGRLLWL